MFPNFPITHLSTSRSLKWTFVITIFRLTFLKYLSALPCVLHLIHIPLFFILMSSYFRLKCTNYEAHYDVIFSFPCIGNKNFIKPFPFKGWTRVPSLMKILHKRSTATLPWPTDQQSGCGQHLELNLLLKSDKKSFEDSGECPTSQHIKLIRRSQQGHSCLGTTMEPVTTF